VAWAGQFPATTTTHPVSSAYLVTEQGAEHSVTIEDRILTIKEQLPVGYHSLHLSGAEPALVISAPIRAQVAPTGALGIMAPTYSMRSERGDSGIGTFRHLAQLADIGLVTGASVIGTLPLVATFPDEPSPYSPASRRAWNELFIDLTAAPGWEGENPTYSGDPLWVDYDIAGSSVRAAIADYAITVADLPQIQGRIDGFITANPEMARYAAFRATSDRHGRNWRAWPDDAAGHPD